MKQNRFSKTFKYDQRWGFGTELDMFRWIWSERPHVSFVSGRPVQDDVRCFAHVLPKGLNKYPHFRLNPDNVVLLTPEEHYLYDQGCKCDRDEYPGDFTALEDKAEKLKQAYQELYG